MLGAACLAVLIPLSFLSPAALAVGSDALGAVFFVYAATGVILAAALAYAPNETLWALMMFFGLCAFIAITIWCIFGIVAGVGLIAGLLLISAAVLRRQLHTVMEHTVHVMVFYGKYHRTLRPGLNIRLPGEQVLSIIHTAEITIEGAVQDVVLLNGRHLDAGVTIGCCVIPERAHQLAPRGNEWPAHVRHMLEITLHDTLSELAPEEIGTPDGSLWGQDEALARRLQGRLQRLIQGWGIQILWVHPHNFRLLDAPLVRQDQLTTPTISASPTAANPDRADGRAMAPGSLLLLPPSLRRDLPISDALIAAYNAVRERHISDPRAIERIAQAFEQAAQDATLRPILPFDAQQAAYHLRQLAQRSATT